DRRSRLELPDTLSDHRRTAAFCRLPAAAPRRSEPAAAGRRGEKLRRTRAGLGPASHPAQAGGAEGAARIARPARLDDLARQPAPAGRRRRPRIAAASGMRARRVFATTAATLSETQRWQRSAGSHYLASSTASLTGRSRRRPYFAKCGEIHTSSWS